MNLEKTQSNTLVTLSGRAIYVWTQVKFWQSPSGHHQYAPNTSISSWVCVNTTIALIRIIQTSQHHYQTYYVKIKQGHRLKYRGHRLLH